MDKYQKLKSDPERLAKKRDRDRIYQRLKYEENRSDPEKLAKMRERDRMRKAKKRAQSKPSEDPEVPIGRCKRDHDAPRRTDSGACTECCRMHAKARHARIKADPEMLAEYKLMRKGYWSGYRDRHRWPSSQKENH